MQDILEPPSIASKLAELFRYVGDHDIPLYVLIDEYDNFANTVLAHHGAEAYHSFTHGGGFFRSFFAALKGGTDRSGGGIDRLFITGVSPVTMDDVTSGFNIGTNVSLHPDFNEMVGFTEAEVRRLVDTYRERGVFNQDVVTAMGIMREWYDGYRFAKDSATDLYNTDMVLYYLKHSMPNRGVGGSRTSRGGGRRGEHAVGALSDRRAAGTAVSGGAVHRPRGSVPRLGDGVLRRGAVAEAQRLVRRGTSPSRQRPARGKFNRR